MIQAWEKAVIEACKSSSDPLIQLEQILYAGIDSGAKYAFLIKLNEIETSFENELTEHYLQTRNALFEAILALQKEHSINAQLPLAWIKILFSSVITATITALRSGDIAPNEVKNLAWYSFRQSIGIK